MSNLFGSAAYGALEAALNRLLALDGASAGKLAALQGSRFRFDCTQPPLSVHILATERGLLLSGSAELEADVSLRGSALALARLLNDSQLYSFHGSGLEVKGDLDKARRLQELLGGLRIDWEYQLSKAIGDIPSHLFGQLLRGGLDLARQNSQRLRENVDEYLHEERRLTPDREEIEELFAAIHALRLDADRLTARVRLLDAGTPVAASASQPVATSPAAAATPATPPVPATPATLPVPATPATPPLPAAPGRAASSDGAAPGDHS